MAGSDNFQPQVERQKPGRWKRNPRGRKLFWALLGLVVLIVIIVAATTSRGGNDQTPSGTTATVSTGSRATTVSIPGQAMTTTTKAMTTTTAAVTTTTEAMTTTTAAQTETTASASGTYSDGTYLVGLDIPPGTYRGTTMGGSGHWQISNDPTGLDIVASEDTTGPFYLQVKSGQFLVLSQAKITGASAVPAPAAPASTGIADGTYLVGIDIAAGRYKGTTTGGNGYWQISSDPNGQEIVANDSVTASFYVEVTKGQYLRLRGVTITK